MLCDESTIYLLINLLCERKVINDLLNIKCLEAIRKEAMETVNKIVSNMAIQLSGKR